MVSYTYWTQKLYSLANFNVVAIHGYVLEKDALNFPNKRNLCHLGTTA